MPIDTCLEEVLISYRSIAEFLLCQLVFESADLKSLRVRRFVVSCHAFYRSTPWLCAWLQTSSRCFPGRFGARHFVVQYSANLQIPWDVCHKSLSKLWNSEKLFGTPHTLCPSSWNCCNSYLFDMGKIISCSEIFRVPSSGSTYSCLFSFKCEAFEVSFSKERQHNGSECLCGHLLQALFAGFSLFSFCVTADFYFASTASLLFRHAFGVELSNASWSH